MAAPTGATTDDDAGPVVWATHRVDLSGLRAALVYDDAVYVTSYADHALVALAWPACDRTLRRAFVHRPRGVARRGGRLYVASYGDPMGEVVSFDAETFRREGSFAAWRPRGVAVWGDAVLVSEVNRGRVAAYEPSSGRLVRAWYGFREPRGVSLDASGKTMVVADTANDRVVRVGLEEEDKEAAASRRVVVGANRPNDAVIFGDWVVWSEWRAGRVVAARSDGRRRTCARVARGGTPAMVTAFDAGVLVCDAARDCVYEIRFVDDRHPFTPP